jgi:hypothetical protein
MRERGLADIFTGGIYLGGRWSLEHIDRRCFGDVLEEVRSPRRSRRVVMEGLGRSERPR